MTVAYLRRERLYGSGSEYQVRIGHDYTDDDGLEVSMGQVRGAWWDVPLPPCPDCGGQLVWYEAGYVPGTRCCTACGSLFSVRTRAGEAGRHPPFLSQNDWLQGQTILH